MSSPRRQFINAMSKWINHVYSDNENDCCSAINQYDDEIDHSKCDCIRITQIESISNLADEYVKTEVLNKLSIRRGQ